MLLYHHHITLPVQRKCTQYWPDPQDGTLSYGNIEVQLVEEMMFPFYVLRKFQISQV